MSNPATPEPVGGTLKNDRNVVCDGSWESDSIFAASRVMLRWDFHRGTGSKKTDTVRTEPL